MQIRQLFLPVISHLRFEIIQAELCISLLLVVPFHDDSDSFEVVESNRLVE